MTGFALDERGDILLERGEIQLVEGEELLCQTVGCLLGANLKEWFLNASEGIDLRRVLGKEVNEEAVRSEVMRGLTQVDERLTLKTFSMEREGRALRVSFTAQGPDGVEIRSDKKWL